MPSRLPRWGWALLARAIVWAHLTFCAAVIAAPWLPWWAHSDLIVGAVWGLAANRWRCRCTQWEYACRRLAGDDAAPRGLVRRLLNAPGRLLPHRWRWDVGERAGTAMMIGALILSLAVRAWLRGPAFWQ